MTVQDFKSKITPEIRDEIRRLKRSQQFASRETDPQRANLYTAEIQTAMIMRSDTWLKPQEIQAYLDSVLGSKWFNDRFETFNLQPLKIMAQRSKWSYYKRSEHAIHFGPAVTSRLVLHELTHALIPWFKQGRDLPAHGAAFCRTYLEIIWQFMGAEYGRTMKAAFAANGVRYYNGLDAGEKAAGATPRLPVPGQTWSIGGCIQLAAGTYGR